MASTQKIHNHATDDDFDNQILYNETERSSALSKNNCGVCERRGFPLFLVRQSIIPKNYQNIEWSKDMIKIGYNKTESLQAYEYVYRTLRTGYLYILVQETTGKYRYLAYEITPSGVFRHKSIENVVEHNIHEIPKQCTAKNDHIPGVFINIDRSRYSGIAYLGYSRRAWSRPALDYYRNAANNSDTTKLERFTQINLGVFKSPSPTPEQLSNGISEKRIFPMTDFDPGLIHRASEVITGIPSLSQKKLMEVELKYDRVIYDDPDKTLTEQLAAKEFGSNSFVTAHKFNSFKSKETQNTSSNANNFVNKLFSHAGTLAKRNSAPVSVVVVDDPFGIAEELCLQRQLFIEPILTLSENSANEFGQSIAEVFKERVNGQNDLDKFDVLFKESIDNYRETNPEEANKLYGEDDTQNSTQTKDKNATNLVKFTLFDDLYTHIPSLYLQPYVADKEYFSERSLHLRKIADMVDHYKINLKDYFNNSEQFKYFRFYEVELNNSQSYDNSIDAFKFKSESTNQAAYYINKPDIYKEILLTEQDKSKLITSYNQSRMSWAPKALDYRVFKSNSVTNYEAKTQYKEEIAKVADHINKKTYDDFIKENNQYFTNISKSIVTYSTDYFNYLGWLFSSKEHPSYYFPALKSNNNSHFWLIESDQNCSNNHLGYLQDFIRMTDVNAVGKSCCMEFYGVWDILLSHSESLYYRLFNSENEKSFWNLMIDARLAQDSVTAIKDSDKTLTNAIKSVKKTHNNDLDPAFCDNKGQKIIDLYHLIIQKAVSGASQFDSIPMKSRLRQFIDKSYFKTHLCQAMMVFNKTYARIIQVSVPTQNLEEFLQYWSSSYGLFVEKDDKEMLALINQISAYQTVGNGSYAEGTKSVKQWTYQILDLTNNITKEWGEVKKIKFNMGKTTITETYSDMWRTERQSLATKSNMSEQGRSVLLNAFNLFLTFESLNANLAELEKLADEQFGQLYKDRLIASINKTRVNMVAQTMIALNPVLKLLIGASKRLTFLKFGKSGIRVINSIMKGAGSITVPLALAASGILGIISILDSISTIQDGASLIDDGEVLQGTALLVCGGVEAIIGIAVLLQTFRIIALSGPWAIELAILAAVVGLIIYLLRDQTLDWIPIEVWANRTLFGQHKKPKKWPFYPPNLLGAGIATNDYLAAIQGLNSNIEFGQTHESTYYDRIDIHSNRLTALDQKFSTYLENRKKVAAGSKQEEILKSDWYSYVETNLHIDGKIFQDAIDQQIYSLGGGTYTGISTTSSSPVTDSRAKAVTFALGNELTMLKSGYSFQSRGDMQGLYIQMTLPKYDAKISILEAYLHISSGDKTMILSIINTPYYPKITNLSADILPTVALRADNKEPIRDTKEGNTEGITQNEYYGKIKLPKTQIETGLPILVYNEETKKEEPIWEETDSFKITYKVAEIYGDHTIYLKVNYWQEGKSKVIKMADDTEQTISLAPLVQVYNYQQ